MRKKYQTYRDPQPDLIPTCMYHADQPHKQCCPLLTRARLMTALGICLLTTVFLLVQCVPGAFRPDIFCCQNSGGGDVKPDTALSMNTPTVVRAGVTGDDDDPDDDLVFTDQEYDDKAEGGDRIHYKHTRRRLPQCIIIGVRKGGTRALLEFLNLHPSIQAQKQEMHFFDEDDNYMRGLEWYRRKMPWSYSDQITIEKTPAYFVQEKVPARVHYMNSSIKILLILRDPIERTISDYMQIHTSKLFKGRSHDRFEDIVIDPDTGGIDKSYKPIRRSIYHKHMEQWLRYFDLSQFHIVNGDVLVSDPVEELRKVESFLGLQHHLSRDNFYFNETKGFYCMHLQTRQKCLAHSKGRSHPDVDPSVIQKLRDFFRPLNSKFYDMVGMNYGWKQ